MDKEQTTTPSSDDGAFTDEERLTFQLDRARMPPLFRSSTWDSFEFNQKAIVKTNSGSKLSMRLELFQIWRAQKPDASTVFLSGPPGTGKTHLAAATVHRWITAGKSGALFVVVGELLALLRRGFDDGTASGTLDQAKYAELLVLDDIGSEMATDWVRDTLYMVVNYRINHLKPTVVTSNLGLNEIAKRYHERLASRLAGGLVIDMSLLKDHRVAERS